MDDEKAEAKKASQPTSGGLGNVVKLVVKTFLEEKHYRQLNRILSAQWAGTHSLTAVVRLMEAHGIKVTPEEEERLQGLSEERMIDALVQRMPNQRALDCGLPWRRAIRMWWKKPWTARRMWGSCNTS